jgi:hypothetical protein
MKDSNNQIEKLNALVLEYYNVDIQDGGRLSTMPQKITGVLYFLEETRAEIHDLWQTKVYKLVEGGASVSRAENEAHVEYPQMYQLRRLMDAGYRVADSIRTRISYLKNELNNINT